MCLVMNTTLGIKKYSMAELHSIATDERHAVRDEAQRRHAKAAKRMADAKWEVECLERLLKIVL